MGSEQFARVAVDISRFALDKPYDYRIPLELEHQVRPGMRVMVPFGRGNAKLEGIVLSLEQTPSYAEPKCIQSCLDTEPVLTAEQIRLALWMRGRFFCTVYEAVHAMLPSGMWFRDGERRAKDKTELFVIPLVDGEEAMEAANQKRLRAKQQAAILRLLAVTGPVALKDLRTFTGASPGSVQALAEQGYIELEAREVLRSRTYEDVERAEPIVLSPEQETAFHGLSALLTQGAKAALLFGVTGSGKTSVYIRLIQTVLEQGKRAIVMVPEIALTPQLVSIFSAHFGGDIAVLHSSLAMGERYDEWKRIKSGSVKVVIGTRSAVFAPVEDLGLIVIDEEQEHTYKSENAPRYHARDVAKYRCAQSGALLLLGSATPSVESMYSAQMGKYALFTLKGRYNTKSLPPVYTADMRKEIKNGNGTNISSVLLSHLRENLERGEQSILFLNRRGTASLVVCGECGYVHSCPNCSVSLTYHASNRRLMCHHCGFSQSVREVCPECGGMLKFTGAGTQKVEEELKELLPGTEIIRMDTDTVTAAHSHEALLSRFREENVPILLGTQMVTKGLDFANVTLVGVLSADQSLYVNDYRANERTFSLITQVVGRSGRGEKTGRAVIQTFTPQNEIIRLASKQDYMGFYEQEILLRKAMLSPPAADLYTITVTGLEETAVLRGCVKLRDSLRHYFADRPELRILGPAPASIAKINLRYRYRITITCTDDKRVRETIAHLMREFSNDKENRGLSVFADKDPLD